LNEEKKQQVIALGRLGWSLRRIQKNTGVRRETAARLSESCQDRFSAARRLGTAVAGKTGQRGDHRLCGGKTSQRDHHRPGPGKTGQ
jgi:hypothetical protein